MNAERLALSADAMIGDQQVAINYTIVANPTGIDTNVFVEVWLVRMG